MRLRRTVRLPHGGLSRACAGHAARRRGAVNGRSAGLVGQARRGVYRRVAAAATSGRIAGRDDLASEAARRCAGQHLVAGYRIRCAGAGHAAILRTGPASRSPAVIGAGSGVLLSGELLDVVERGEACGGAGLYACRPGIPTAPTAGRSIICRWRRALRCRDRRRLNERSSCWVTPPPTPFPKGRGKIGSHHVHCSSCWMIRANANSRCSILPGTSHA